MIYFLSSRVLRETKAHGVEALSLDRMTFVVNVKSNIRNTSWIALCVLRFDFCSPFIDHCLVYFFSSKENEEKPKKLKKG